MGSTSIPIKLSCDGRCAMSVHVTYRNHSSAEVIEIEYSRGMILPKVQDSIVSPIPS